MKNFILIIPAVIVKILATITLGLFFTDNIATYVSIVSRTHPISFRFILYIVLVDIITLVIITSIAKAYFRVSQNLKKYLIFSALALIFFCLSDVIFIIEIKSAKVLSHIFTLVVLILKYLIFMFVSSSFIIKMHKVDAKQLNQLFLNYLSFRYKRIINNTLFSYSKLLYRRSFLIAISVSLLLLLNLLSLFLYATSLLLHLCVVMCAALLFYLILILVHQLTIVLNIYKAHNNNIDH